MREVFYDVLRSLDEIAHTTHSTTPYNSM